MSNANDIVSKMTALVDTADAENRSMTEAELGEYETLETSLTAAHKTAELRSRTQAYARPTNLNTATAPAAKDGEMNAELRAFDSYLRTADAAEYRAQSEGVPSEGGYLVPTLMAAKLTERMKAFGGLAAVVQNLSTATGATIEWPTIDDTANSGVISAEGAAAGSGGADLVFGTVNLGAYKYNSTGGSNLPLRVSAELLTDAVFDVQDLVARKLR